MCVCGQDGESRVINDSHPTADSNGLAAIRAGHPLVRGKISQRRTLMGSRESSSNRVFKRSYLESD